MSTFSVDVSAPERETALPPAPAPALAGAPLSTPGDSEEPALVDEATVRSLLRASGVIASTLDRVPDADGLWRWREDELDTIVPPITRYANRSPALRRALVHGDAVVIAMTLGTYGARNVTARKAAIDAHNQRESARAAGAHGEGAGGPGGVAGGAPVGSAGGPGGPLRPGFPGAAQ